MGLGAEIRKKPIPDLGSGARGQKGTGSRIPDPDPGLGAFLTPGSGIRDEQPGSYFLELRNQFFCFFWG
jgi:hypothetical protein